MHSIALYGEKNWVEVTECKNVINIYLLDFLSHDNFYNNVIITLLLIKKWRKINPFMRLESMEFDEKILYMNAAITRKGNYQIIEFQIEYKEKLEDAILAFNSLLGDYQKAITDAAIKEEVNNLVDFINSKANRLEDWALSQFYLKMFQGDPFVVGEYEGKIDIEIFKEENLLRTFEKKYIYLPSIIMVGDRIEKENLNHKKLCSDWTGIGEERKFDIITKNQYDKQCYIIIGYRVDCFMHSRYYWPMVLVNTLLAGEKDAILVRTLRDEYHLSYDTFSLYDEIKGFMMIRITSNITVAEQVEKQVEETLEKISRGAYDLECLQRAKKILIRYYKEGGILEIMDFYLKQQLCGIKENVEDSINKILNVTKDEISIATELIKKHTTVIVQ